MEKPPKKTLTVSNVPSTKAKMRNLKTSNVPSKKAKMRKFSSAISVTLNFLIKIIPIIIDLINLLNNQ